MKFDDAPPPLPPLPPAGPPAPMPPGASTIEPMMYSSQAPSGHNTGAPPTDPGFDASYDTKGAPPPGYAVPSPAPYYPKTAPPNAQEMHGQMPMQAPAPQPYPNVHATGVPVMQTAPPPAVMMTHAPAVRGRPERNVVPYGKKREAWEKKAEHERQHDRAFAMQAAYGAEGPAAHQVAVPMHNQQMVPHQQQHQQQYQQQQQMVPYQQQQAPPQAPTQARKQQQHQNLPIKMMQQVVQQQQRQNQADVQQMQLQSQQQHHRVSSSTVE